jgi:acyl-coenzyme A thioesterase PaaI-like protein
MAEANKAAAIRIAADFGFDPLPGEDGWFVWGPREDGRFNTLYDPILVRPLDGNRALVRFTPQRVLTSANGTMHGGGLLGFIDIALFAGARGCGVLDSGWAMTLDLSTQFIGPARHGVAIDAEVELLRETGRLLFLRGVVTQEEESVASFSATVRKSSARA